MATHNLKIALTGTGTTYEITLTNTDSGASGDALEVQQGDTVNFTIDWSNYHISTTDPNTYPYMECILIFKKDNPFDEMIYKFGSTGTKTFSETVTNSAALGTDDYTLVLSPIVFVKDPQIIIKD